jgi:hypothetical protein
MNTSMYEHKHGVVNDIKELGCNPSKTNSVSMRYNVQVTIALRSQIFSNSQTEMG